MESNVAVYNRRQLPATQPRGRGEGSTPDEAELIQSLRKGNEQSFASLVSMHQAPLRGTALKYVRDVASAEEVVQETWLAFLNSLDRFQGRCSIKTWLFRILMNKAKTRGCRDRRSVPFSSLVSEEIQSNGSSVAPECFTGPDAPGGAGFWVSPPAAWRRSPDSMLMDRETMEFVGRAIDALPQAQGAVMRLRDMNDMSANEVCEVLGVTPGNQRVLLHRARTKVRQAISEHEAAL